MRGDCSIRIDGIGFTAEEIAACSARQGLLSIELELSASDQCTCTNCLSQPSPQPVLSRDEISALITQARQLGARRVILIDSVTGPYPHLRAIIEEIRANQMQVELFSGDTEITSEFAEFLFEHNVNISIDDSAGWLLQRPPVAAEAATPLISRLIHVGYGGENAPSIAMRISVDSHNVDQIPAVWRWCRSNNIEPNIQIIKPTNGFDQPLRYLAPDRSRKLFEQLGEIDGAEFRHTWTIPPSLIGRSCKRHLFAAHVSACGTLYACVGVTIPLGSIRTESLRDILTLSEVLEDIRAFGDKVKEPCGTCSKTTDCYGCRGAAYQLTGDYLAGDQMCWKAESTVIEALPVNVSHLIPHGPSMRMVDQLVQIGERRASASFTISRDSPWIDEQGRLDDLAYIEIIAQSFAATHGFHMPPELLGSHKGLLLGVTNLAISGQARAGDQLKIEIRKMTRFGDFGIVEGEVRHQDGRLIATGQVKVWRPSEEIAAELTK